MYVRFKGAHPPAPRWTGSCTLENAGKSQPICVSGKRGKSKPPQRLLEPWQRHGVARCASSSQYTRGWKKMPLKLPVWGRVSDPAAAAQRRWVSAGKKSSREVEAIARKARPFGPRPGQRPGPTQSLTLAAPPAPPHARSLLAAARAINGRRISTISPPSGRLKADTFPPWKRTALSVIAKPKPTPPVRRPRASSSR